MPIVPYNRAAAVAYAHRWAYDRNPAFYDYDDLGGDCTNFTSQCIFAGSGVMNYTPVYGWYYIDANNKSPSWTGVPYLYNFMTANRGLGPFAEQVGMQAVLPGDFLQLGDGNGRFYHSPFIVSVSNPPSPATILVAAHTYDADNRPLNTYNYGQVRFVHILGVRR